MTIASAMDTAPEVFDLLIDKWRTMSPFERAALADRLSIDVAALAVAGIRVQNPGIDDANIAHELARRRYGTTLADAAYCRAHDA